MHEVPITLSSTSENEAIPVTVCGTPTQQQAPTRSKRTQFPKEAFADLIRLIHGNIHGKKFLGREFISYWTKKNDACQISMNSLLNKIRDIGKWMSCPEEGPMHQKVCWYVSEEIRKEYIEEDLSLPNRWSYTLIPKRKSDFSEIAEKLDKEEKEKEKEKKTVPLITHFTKKITQEEMKKQLTVKPGETSSPQSKKPVQPKTAKRATMISVARGEQFSKALKENLLKSFVNNNETVNENSGKNGSSDENGKELSNKEGKSSKKEVEDRLGTAPMECDSDSETEEKSSTNTEQNKNDTKSQCGTLDKDAKGIVDNVMVIDICRSAEEN